MPDEQKTVEVTEALPVATTGTTVPMEWKITPPPNFTRSLEDLNKERADEVARVEAEKAAKKAALYASIKEPRFIIEVCAFVLQVIIIIAILIAYSHIKSSQKEQTKVNTSIADYISADAEVAKQVKTNTDSILEINKTMSEQAGKIGTIDAQSERIEEIAAALTKVNKLSVMNRNRLYMLEMKENPEIENAFNEEKLDGDVIQENTNSVVLAMSKAIEAKSSEKNKSKAKKEAEEAKKAAKLAEEKNGIKVAVPPPGANDEVKKPVKKDYLLFIKPWKWSWFHSDKKESAAPVAPAA